MERIKNKSVFNITITAQIEEYPGVVTATSYYQLVCTAHANDNTEVVFSESLSCLSTGLFVIEARSDYIERIKLFLRARKIKEMILKDIPTVSVVVVDTSGLPVSDTSIQQMEAEVEDEATD